MWAAEPNSGQPWTGAACANECNLFINGYAKLYAATGDPVILAYLRGMLERWSLLYQDVEADDIWDYSAPFAECFGIFDAVRDSRLVGLVRFGEFFDAFIRGVRLG